MSSITRKKREREARQREIQKAARAVFAAKGFNGATMEEIAERADYSPATLYLYFKNKQELYSSLIVRYLENLAKKMEELAGDESRTPLEMLDRLPDVMFEAYRFDPDILLSLFHLQAGQGLKDLSEETAARINVLAGRSIRAMAEVFRRGIERGDIEPHKPMALADSVWAIFTGLVLWEESKTFFNPNKSFLKPTLHLAMGAMVEGVRKKDRQES